MDQRKVIQQLSEQTRNAMVSSSAIQAQRVTDSYNTIMGQAVDDLNQFYEASFGGGGTLNYTDYKRLAIDEAQIRMLRPYLNELQKITVDQMQESLQQMYWDSYRMNTWALDQTTPPNIDVAAVHDLGADPASDFYLQTFLKSQTAVEWKGAMFSQRLGVINDKMARNIQSITDGAMVNGWSTQDLSMAIRDEVGIPLTDKLVTRPRASAAKSRADMIARSEMMRAADAAKQYLYSQNKDLVDDEKWLTSDLDNVCDDCDANDGQLFSDLGERPPMHPRCACTGVPVLASWGKLLGPDYAGMKDQSIAEWEMSNPDPEDNSKLVSATIQPYDEWLADQ